MIDPRICVAPSVETSLGREAVDLAASAGLILDDWQAYGLELAMGVRDGKWAAFEVAWCVGRQNGKNGGAEARQLAGLFLLKEPLQVHSAHLFDTSREHQRRLTQLVQDTPELHKKVKPRGYKNSHGEESIELRSGCRIRFRTRTAGGGRGLTGDTVYLDEAMELQEATMGALIPTMAARSVIGNPQLWYLGSAVDQAVHQHGRVFAGVRDRALSDDPGSLVYLEWSVDLEARGIAIPENRPFGPEDVTEAIALDPSAWEEANPALGIRISPEYVLKERRSLSRRSFAVERLGVGDWPDVENADEGPITIEAWQSRLDTTSRLVDPFCLAFDVTPEQSHVAVAAVGRNTEGKIHGEVIEHRRGTRWLIDRLAELRDEHRPAVIVCDGSGPAKALIPELREAGFTEKELKVLTAGDHAAGCGMLVARVNGDDDSDGEFVHLGDEDLDAAIRGAVAKSAGDAWKWTRAGSTVNIAPLVAVTIGLFGFYEFPSAATGPMVAYA